MFYYLFISPPIIIFNTFSAKNKQYPYRITAASSGFRDYKAINKWAVRVLLCMPINCTICALRIYFWFMLKIKCFRSDERGKKKFCLQYAINIQYIVSYIKNNNKFKCLTVQLWRMLWEGKPYNFATTTQRYTICNEKYGIGNENTPLSSILYLFSFV